MNISFSFDDNEISADEPLGTVDINDGHQRLNAKTVYLDDFLAGLIDAHRESLIKGNSTVELDTEPLPIRMERVGDGLKISYGKAEISIQSIAEFECSLKKAASEFLGIFAASPVKTSKFSTLESFVNGN